jgi:hypothetical protein
MPADFDRALTNAELLEELRELTSEINWRLENYIEATEDLDAVEEGWLLAQRAKRIWEAKYHGNRPLRDSFLMREIRLEQLLSAAEEVESDA